MRAHDSDLLPFLKEAQQFEVPIYQRMYDWEHSHCVELFDDILKCGRSSDPDYKHFIGSIVYVESEKFQPPKGTPRLIIDGQQRLTTIMLLLHAISTKITERISQELDVPKSLAGLHFRFDYLVNQSESEDTDDYFKLILSQRDKETFKSLITDRDIPSKFSKKILSNYDLLYDLISKNADELDTIMNGINKLVIVVIKLQKDIDNPQLVFESMNSTGKPLSESDKIRNFILMGLEPDLQKRLYTDYWQPMEEIFRSNEKHFDLFMRHYLTVQAGTIIDVKKIYPQFKAHANGKSNEDVVADVKKFAEYYSKIAFDTENDVNLKNYFSNFKDLQATVVYPFALVLYDDYTNDILEKQDFLEILSYCESYVFRLLMASISSSSRDKAFVHLAGEMRKDENKENYVLSVKQHFQWLSGKQYFPRDEQFIEDIKRSNMYKEPSKAYWLRKIEMYQRKEPLPLADLTREHIMPQTLTDEWKEELGDNWQQDHNELIDNLGNLTLTGYNSEYSNYPFAKKRDLEGKGLRYSPLFLNKGFGDVPRWNRAAIVARAERLAKRAIFVWPFPDIEGE